MKKKSSLVIVALLVICSLLTPIRINYKTQQRMYNLNYLNRYISLSRWDQVDNSKIVSSIKPKIGFRLKNELNIYDGIVNSIVVSGNYFRNTITSTILDYLDGFNNKTSQMKVVWLFFGLFLELLKNMILSGIDFLLMIFILLIQSINSYSYMLSYILTILFVIGMLKVTK